MAKTNILFPTGRIVAGNLYTPNTTNAEGAPLVYKHGANAGQPRVDYFFAVAIPKDPAVAHWASTPWGALIWGVGHAFMANASQIDKFAWKVTDGDSSKPNTKGVKPCDREGYPGNWVVMLSSSFAPKVCNADGSAVLTAVDAVQPGDFVQVFGNVDGNGSQQQPGVFINHSAVALQGYGERITFGADTKSMGFGGQPLPPGASTVPPGNLNAANVTPPPPAPPGAPAIPGAPVAPGTVAPPAPPAPPGVPGTAVPAPSVPVVPNPGILAVPAAPAHTMTAAAQGATYEQLVASGWTDALLVQHGLMTA